MEMFNMKKIAIKKNISTLFSFLTFILLILFVGCNPQKKIINRSLNNDSQSSIQRSRKSRHYIYDTGKDPDPSESQEKQIYELKVDAKNVLTITKDSTFSLMNRRKINDISVSLLAVPSLNFEAVLADLRLEESMKLSSDTIADSNVLDRILEDEKYKNNKLVLLDSSFDGGLLEDNYTTFIKVDFDQKKTTRGYRTIDGDKYSDKNSTEQDLWMMKQQYMTSDMKWSKSWVKDSTRYTPLSLKYILKFSQAGDTYKTFFMVSVSSVKNGLPTSDLLYISGLDDYSNSNLVQEFTVTL